MAPRTPRTAARNARLANRRGSTAGRSVASSKRMNRTPSGTTTSSPTRPSAPSPSPRPRTATSSAMSTAASSTRPGTSMPGPANRRNGPGRVGVTATTPASERDDSRTATAANVATGTASRNSACQPSAPTSRPPMNGPIAALIDVSMSNRPNAAPRRVDRSDGPHERQRGRRDQRSAQRLEDPSTAPGSRTRARPLPAATTGRRRRRRRGRPVAGRIGRPGCRWPGARSSPCPGRG